MSPLGFHGDSLIVARAVCSAYSRVLVDSVVCLQMVFGSVTIDIAISLDSFLSCSDVSYHLPVNLNSLHFDGDLLQVSER